MDLVPSLGGAKLWSTIDFAVPGMDKTIWTGRMQDCREAFGIPDHLICTSSRSGKTNQLWNDIRKAKDALFFTSGREPIRIKDAEVLEVRDS